MTDVRVPPISTGLNRYTPELWERQWQAVQSVEQLRKQVESLRNLVQQQAQTSFPAFLMGFKTMSTEDNRWIYAWKRATLTLTGDNYTAAELTGVSSYNDAGTDPFFAPAINLLEIPNDGLQVESGGVDTE